MWHELVDGWLFLSPSRVLGNFLVSGSDDRSSFECGGQLIVKPVKYPYLRVRVHSMHGVIKLNTITITVIPIVKIPWMMVLPVPMVNPCTDATPD